MISKSIFQEIYDNQETSTFVYDLDAFDLHLQKLSKSLPKNVKTYYATKANPLSSILKCVNKNKIGIDVASLGELNQALTCGVDPKNILATGPAKSKKKLKFYLEKGINFFVIESINQLKDLNHLAKSFNLTPRVLLRVQLTWQDDTKSVLGGNAITPFGLDKDQWLTIKASDFKSLVFEGFHVFQWGNILSVPKLEKIWTAISKECLALSHSMNIEPNTIDFGGGWGISYTDDSKLDISEVSKALSKISNFKQIYIELGRFAIGEFGYYMSEVIDRKVVRGQELLVLDGGMNHLIRPALTNQSFPSQLLRDSNKSKKSFQIHGPLCSSLDTIGQHDLPQDIQVGDIILFSKCGAYGFTESMPFFLCHDIASEVIFLDGKIKTIRPSVDASWWLV